MLLRKAWDVAFAHVGGPSTSLVLQGPPGLGKSSLGAEMARARVRERGGVFMGWEAHDRVVVENPPAGPAWSADWSDPRSPVVTAGEPDFVYRHMFVPGTSPLSWLGVTIPDRSDRGVVTTTSRPLLLCGMPDRAASAMLVLDEMAKAPELWPVLASLLHGGRAGEHEMPGRSNIVVGLANRVSDRAGAKVLTMDLVNRLMVLDVEADQDADVAWARREGHPAWAVAFAASGVGRELIYSGHVPDRNEPFPSPRSWWKAVGSLCRLTEDAGAVPDPEHPTTHAVLLGWVGDKAARAITQWLVKALELPEIGDLYADPEGVPLPQRPDLVLLVAEMIAAGLASPKWIARPAPRAAAAFTLARRLPPLGRTALAQAIDARVDAKTPEGADLMRVVINYPELTTLWS